MVSVKLPVRKRVRSGAAWSPGADGDAGFGLEV